MEGTLDLSGGLFSCNKRLNCACCCSIVVQNFDSYEPIAEQFPPVYCADGQKQRVWELADAMILRGARVACRGPVGAIPAKVATSGMIYTHDLHVFEDPQPVLRPALLADVATQRRS